MSYEAIWTGLSSLPLVLAEQAPAAQSNVQNVLWLFFAGLGAVICQGMGAFGSAMGIGVAGQAAAGAWAKEARAGRTLSFSYIILLGMPISQTLYSMIVMNSMANVLANETLAVSNAGLLLGIGISTGLGEMLSAWLQGAVGAAGIRALCEGEGKGLALMIIALGIIETVGIFTMVFMLGMIPAVPSAG